MSPLFDESDVGDLDDTEREPVIDADWEQSAAAVESEAGPAPDVALLPGTENEARDEDKVAGADPDAAGKEGPI